MSHWEEDDLPLSRTKKKQQAKQVEALAEQLATLGDNQFAQLELPDAVSHEIQLARATKGHGSKRRQVKHLAGVLRKEEEVLSAILEQMDGLDQVARAEKRQFHQLESLRERLCQQATFDTAFNEMLELFPDIDRKVIARLARSVHQHEDKRAYREIFKRLRESMQD